MLPKTRTRFLVIVFLFFVLAIIISPYRNVNAAGSIAGVVFRDLNDNGVRGTFEPGVGGVTITAYDSTGAVVGTATSSSTRATLGQYTLNFTGSDTTVRVEFTGIPDGYESGAVGSGAGVISGTTVQFVNAGGSANLGIFRPRDSCGNNPQIFTSCYVPGNNSTIAPAQATAVVYNYTVDATNGNFVETSIGQTNTIGTTFGIAFHTLSQQIFAGTYVRRGSGVGPTNSTGTIYRLDPTGGAAPQVFLELNGFAGINTGTNPHSNTDGTVNWVRDPQGFFSVA